MCEACETSINESKHYPKKYGVLPFNKYGELDFECETEKYKKYKRFKGKLYLILLIYG